MQTRQPPTKRVRQSSTASLESCESSLGLDAVERLCELALKAEISRTVPKSRPNNTGPDVLAFDAPVLVFAIHLIDEQILGDDDVAFSTRHFSDAGDAPGTVAQAFGLNDNVHRADDHFPKDR